MNQQFLRVLFLFLGTIVCQTAWCATPVECEKKIASSLMKLLSEKFLNLRTPKLADLDQASIDYDLSDGGDGCFAVASGDYAGYGNKDVAMLLVPVKGGDPQLVVALAKNDTWTLYQLPTFCEGIAFCYVKTEKPGTYNRSEALDSPPTRPDELEKLTSKNAVVLSGRLESTGIVYAYSNTRWRYVWVSD